MKRKQKQRLQELLLGLGMVAAVILAARRWWVQASGPLQRSPEAAIDVTPLE